jgi:hemerythrin-like domain-containing protein
MGHSRKIRALIVFAMQQTLNEGVLLPNGEGRRNYGSASFLKEDHDRLRKLLEEIDSFDESAIEKRKKTASEFFLELEIHIRLEEEILYPSALEAIDNKGKPIRGDFEEHQRMKEWMTNLKKMPPTDPEYRIQFSLFRETLKHHLEEEERGLFPQSEKRINPGPIPAEPPAEEYRSNSPPASE